MKNTTAWTMLFLLTYVATYAQEAVLSSLEAKLPLVEKFLKEEMEDRKIPGLVYGIFDEEGMRASGAYGLADIQHQVPVNRETVFELASITKQFTAAAILILQQDGLLKVEDKACQYIPECPEAWGEVTIHQLLTHTSGLPGEMKEGKPNILQEFSGARQMDPFRIGLELSNWSRSFMMDLIKTDQLNHPPGEAFDYSNVGYLVLGVIIDMLSGSYRDFLEERIFQPAGMQATYVQDLEGIHLNEARPYTLRQGEVINLRRIYQLEIPASYGVLSNVPDMQMWDAALNSEKILTRESKALMYASAILNNGQSTYGPPIFEGQAGGYGYGWAILPTAENHKVVWHNGSSGTEYLKFVDDKVGIVVLTNMGQGDYDRVFQYGLAEGIARKLGLDLY